MEAAIQISALSKTVGKGRKALQQIDLSLAPGEMLALVGASGSGKSTLQPQNDAELAAFDAAIERANLVLPLESGDPLSV